jgi:hypothetical protein
MSLDRGEPEPARIARRLDQQRSASAIRIDDPHRVAMLLPQFGKCSSDRRPARIALRRATARRHGRSKPQTTGRT